LGTGCGGKLVFPFFAADMLHLVVVQPRRSLPCATASADLGQMRSPFVRRGCGRVSRTGVRDLPPVVVVERDLSTSPLFHYLLENPFLMGGVPCNTRRSRFCRALFFLVWVNDSFSSFPPAFTLRHAFFFLQIPVSPFSLLPLREQVLPELTTSFHVSDCLLRFSSASPRGRRPFRFYGSKTRLIGRLFPV